MSMSYYNLIATIVVFIYFINDPLQVTPVPKYAKAQCVPTIWFANCKSNPENPIVLYNTLRYQLETRILKGCRLSNIVNFYTLRNIEKDQLVEHLPQRRNKATIMIDKFQLELGNYVLTVHVTETPTLGLDVHANEMCYIKMTADCPVPSIRGGALRTAPIGENLRLVAFSLECNIVVTYSWKCESTNRYHACETLAQQKPSKYVSLPIVGRVGDTINITLTAESESLMSRTYMQTIVINEKNTPKVSITCKKNCLTTGAIYSNPKVPIYLIASCSSKCHLVKRYKWNIEALTSTGVTIEAIIENGTHTGVDTGELIVKAHWFNYGEEYSIHLFAYDNKKIIAKSMISIEMASNVGGKSKCTAESNNKLGIERIYKIRCLVVNKLRPSVYQLHQIYKDNEADRLLSYAVANNHVPMFEVRLSARNDGGIQTLGFYVLDDTTVITNMIFFVVVPRPFISATDDEIVANIKHIYIGLGGLPGVKRLLSIGRVEEASQLINIMLCEARRVFKNNPSVRKVLQTSVAEMMKDLILGTQYTVFDYESLLSLVPNIVTDKPKGILHSKLRSRLCKIIATNLGSFIYFEEYPLCCEGLFETLAIPLLSCANTYLNDDYERYTAFNVPLPDPIPEHLTVEENYPNYGEIIDEATADDFREIISNAISIQNTISEAYAQTFTIGEPRVYINFTSNITIDVLYAEDPNKIGYNDGKVRVVLPKSLGLTKNDYVRVVYTTLPAKSFFWDKTIGNISDSVMNVKIYSRKNRRRRKRGNNINLFFKLNKNQRIKILSGEFSVSLASTVWTDDYVEKNMKLFRIELSYSDSLMTVLANIEPVKTLNVAITKFRKPTIKDFTIVTREDKLYDIMYNRSEVDALYYVALLPSEKELNEFNTLKQEKLKITFKYAFMALSCREWTGELWGAHSCDIGSKGDPWTIHCNCRNISSIVADMKSVRVIEERAMKIGFALNITVNLIVPITVIILIGIYCLLLGLIHFRRIPMNLFFLSDNLEDDRYAYLIRVHTGDYDTSSTTSNIIVKLRGDKANSKPHVLNHPDPDRKILQDGGEDYFVLTTRYYLGDIQEMELWYDAKGRRSTWYCEYVKVYDMQTETKWFFRVYKRFTVLVDDKHHYKFVPSSEVGWHAKRKLYNYFHFYWLSDNLWNIFKTDKSSVLSYFRRISILLAQGLTTYAITLALIARPSFRLKDGLSENKFDSCFYILVHSVAIGIVVFALFTPLEMVFRYTPRRHTFLKEEKSIFSCKIDHLCRIFIAGVSCVCLAYLIYFGFWISTIASIMWLSIAHLALLFNAVLLENLKLSIYKWIIGWRVHKKAQDYRIKFNDVVTEAEKQRKFLFNKLGRYGLRPQLKHLYKPLANEKYVELSKKKRIEYKIGKSASDMAFFYIYACMLFFLLLLKLNLMTFVSSKHMTELTVNGSFRNQPTANNVTSFEDLYEYLNNTLAAVLHPMEWYGSWKVSESGLLADYNTKIIGVARIRQKRVREYYCPVPAFARSLNISTCDREYSSKYADVSDAGLSKSMWSFQNVEHGNIQNGEMGTYLGTGFIIKLGRNLNNTYYVIKLMKDANWLSSKTRVVFIEFWTYNCNLNLFNAVTIMFERSATKLLIVSHNISTLGLMHTKKLKEVLTILTFTIFCVLIVKLILKYIRKVLQRGLGIFLTLTNLWEMTIIIANVTITVLYLKQFEENIAVFFKIADNKSNEFISYFKIMNNYQAIRTLTSALFALAIVRGITFMKFISIFRVFEKMLILSFWSFFTVIIFNMFLTVSYALCGYLLFGRYAAPFRNLEATGYTLIKGSLGFHSDFSRSVIENYNTKIGYAFYTIYSLCVIFMKNIYIVIALLYYQRSKRAISRVAQTYTFTQFARDRWEYCKEHWKRRFIRFRLKGGADRVKVKQIATPKDDHFRYGDCVLMSDDQAHYMTLIARVALRKMYFKRKKKSPPTREDMTLMREIVLTEFQTETDPRARSMFFKGKDANGRVKFVSDDKLLEMEYWVNHVLRYSKEMGETTTNLTDTSSLKKLEEIESVLTSIKSFVRCISIGEWEGSDTQY